MKKIIRLGTRGSPLALVQAEDVRARIYAANPRIGDESTIEIVPIRTSGDWRPSQKERTFLEMGGDKGFFTKEIEEALAENAIDMAVHSMKDVPSLRPDLLEIVAIPERVDARDAFVSRGARTLDELPEGAVLGTSSLRRRAQILARRPDIRVVSLRGNVDTRLRKLADGQADATVLAVAGMQRLGITEQISSIFEPDIMLPSAGQGAIGIEIRRDNDEMRSLLTPVHCVRAGACVAAERAFLLILDGSCHTPIGALAVLTETGLVLEVMAARPDGTSLIRMQTTGKAEDAIPLGVSLGEDMKKRLPPDFFVSGI